MACPPRYDDRLAPELLGRELDDALLDALPTGVDPCGENGEFHTFVADGPIYGRPLAVRPAIGQEPRTA